MNSLLISIRCANQSFKDVNVEVETNWTVFTLKSYLQENYPSKPNVKKQRLIYAGQLMKDDQLLSTYFNRNGEIDHLPIVHLVCTPSVDQFCSGAAGSTAGLRQRRPVVQPTVQQIPDTVDTSSYQQPSVSVATDAHAAQTPGAFYGVPAMDPSWQQAQQMYNAYMMQYMQYLQQLYGPTYWPWTVGGNMATIVTPVAPYTTGTVPANAQPNVAPAPAPGIGGGGGGQPQQQARPEPAMNAQGGVDDEDEARNRDWLDWLYMACRAGLLFTILYFYSSMERFSFVMFCCLLIYGFQAGWFGRRGDNNNNNNNARQQQQRNNNEQANRNQQRQLDGAAVAPGNENNRPGENEIPPMGDSLDENRPAAVIEEPQTAWYVFWSTCWTFVSSFFASLVPQRPPPMNLN